MMFDEVKAIVVEKLSFRYPKYPIQFEHVEGDHNLIGVGVFSVSDSDYEEINDYILDLSFELQEDGIMPPEVDLIPFVRDVKTTALHYPEITTRATAGYTLDAILSNIVSPQTVMKSSFEHDVKRMAHIIDHVASITKLAPEFTNQTETLPQVMSESTFENAA